MYRLYLKVNQRILYSNYGPVRFCLWILYQEQRVSPSSSPLPPFFAFVFTSVLQLMRGNVHWYVYHQEANWERTFMRSQVNSIFIRKILSYHKLWHYILQNKENKAQIPSSLSIHLRLRGGTGSNVFLANETFKKWVWWCRCYAWCLSTILWRIIGVPKRWRISRFLWISHMSSGLRRIRTRSRGILGMPVKLLNAIGARMLRMLSCGGHIARSSVSCWSYLTSVRSGYNRDVFSGVLSRV